MNTETKKILVGKITTAHGIKGLVKVQVYAEDPHLLETGGPLSTTERGGKQISLKMKNSMGKVWLAEVAGVTDRNAAETLRNTELWLGRERLPTLADNEYYIADLIGLNAYDEEENLLGVITAVDNFGAGDLIEISPPEKESFYLPLGGETIKQARLDDGIVIISMPGEI